MGLLKKFMALFSPGIPDSIRDEYDMHAAERLHKQSRFLFAVLMLATPALYFAIPKGSGVYDDRLALIPIFALFVVGFFSTMRDLDVAANPKRARRFIRSAAQFSIGVAVLCSLWAVESWLNAPVATRMQFPLVLAMGALASAYCLASARRAAITHLAVDILPISCAMIILGNEPDVAAGVAIIVASIFQVSIINSQHQATVNLLLMRRQARILAETDSLTELPNRRFMIERVMAMGATHSNIRLLLVDVDEFKFVNDNFGHDMGDAVLREVGAIIARHASGAIGVARIGGEEFALYGPADRVSSALGIALLSDIRNHPMPHGKQVTISVGVHSGPCEHSEQWRALFTAADRALYHAKSSGRNCMVDAAELVDRSEDVAEGQTEVESRTPARGGSVRAA